MPNLSPSSRNPGSPPGTSVVKQRSHWVERFLDGWSVYRKNTIGRIGLTLLGIFALMAAASFIPQWVNPIYHPMTGVDPHISYSTGPSLRHWLGTDYIGRDIFSQLLAGARVAFMVGISSALISILFGTTIGMVAGLCRPTHGS
jgi:peptide/nickel transport system permease protein